MRRSFYCLFDTPIGCCGMAWTDGGNRPAVTHFQLPEGTLELTESRIARSSGAREATTPPPEIGQVIKRVCRHLEGDVQDFRDVVLDVTEQNRFPRQVYEAARLIPAGETRTYGGLAKILGRPGAARAVGQALARNPIPLLIPCHRVLAAGGKPGGFSAYGGLATKARLLAIEGASLWGSQGQLFTQP
jgi:O-6-methylguanine DNA methyltransferase